LDLDAGKLAGNDSLLQKKFWEKFVKMRDAYNTKYKDEQVPCGIYKAKISSNFLRKNLI
jgi:hypothetical protein|tara:strand:- start:578 stop:754 length:177 start_codon:yes stop_codon:yes gene_type:complete